MGVTWGVSAWFHDAGLSVIKDGKIVFAGHAERYSGKKHDKMLNKKIIDEALSFGKPNQIAWYEKPWKKNLRKFLLKNTLLIINVPAKITFTIVGFM